LYDRYVAVVYRYVFVRTGNRELAEDITSETFMRALRRIDTFRWQGRDIVAWFLTIARNLVADEWKSARFRLEVTTAELLEHRPGADSPGVASPEEAVLQRQRDERLVEALRTLTPDQAECVLLRFMEGLSLTECAQVLGRKENAVKQLQLRALRALRRELDRAD
jgi:RNA polymerase sigma-70 factor, ECF subfamily